LALIASYEEKLLLLNVAEGDEKAFRQVFELYGKLLFPFLFRLVKSGALAEELIQEVMLRVWLNRDKLPGIQHPRQWIFRIASNLAYTVLQRRLQEGQIFEEISRQEETYEDPDQGLKLRELRHHVQEAVRQMPKERRRIYQCSREAGMSREEIAAQLNISPSTVKNALASALKSIRDYLEKAGYSLPLFFLLFIIYVSTFF
jgi:RNA polymerase sigma-70 factor (ECF subfamily)